MKQVEKKYLLLRIITAPIKLLFTLVWVNLMAFIITFKWIRWGSQEVYFTKDTKDSIIKLIEQNELIIKNTQQNENN